MDAIPEIHRGWIFSLIALGAAYFGFMMLEQMTVVPYILIAAVLFIPPIFIILGIIHTVKTWRMASSRPVLFIPAILGSACCALAVFVIFKILTEPKYL